MNFKFRHFFLYAITNDTNCGKNYKTIIVIMKINLLSTNTSNADKVDLPQPLVPHNSTVTDSFLSRILQRENIIIG
jgi:hypothetical protein